jgi:hypothetical protein
LARRHQELLAAGARVYAISIDSPERNAAMVEKLSLPFPYLSDPDRSHTIVPYGVADEMDDRLISRPALIAITPDRQEAFRFVSRDFADRMPETEVVAAIRRLDLGPTTQDQPLIGAAMAGPRSISLPALRVYLRGARFAALTMGLRHGHHSDEIKEDSKAYVAEMDRFTEALDWLDEQRGP